MRLVQSYPGSLLAMLAVLGLCLIPACERTPEGGGSGPGEGGPGGITPGAGAGVAGDFAPPEPDISGLPPGLQRVVSQLQQAIRSGTANVNMVGQLGAILLVHGMPNDAVACFQRATEVAPSNFQWWYYLGIAHERSAAAQKAVDAYQQALQMKPDYAPLLVRIAFLLIGSDRPQAVALCERALVLDPKNSKAKLVLGLCAEADEKPADALARYQEALEIFPQDGEVHAAMARVLNNLGREKEAQIHASAAAAGQEPLTVDPLFRSLLSNGYDLKALVQGALYLMENDQFDQAEQALEAARIVDQDGLLTAQALAQLRVLQGRQDEADAEYRRLLAERPDSAVLKGELANLLVMLGKGEEAEALFREVVEQEPGNELARQRLGRWLTEFGRLEEAEQVLRSGLQAVPESARLKYELARTLIAKEDFAAARPLLEESLALDPQNERAYFYLGVLHQQLGDLEPAQQAWQRAIEASPQYVEPYVALAASQTKEREFKAAERTLRDGLKYLPQNVSIMNALAWVLATSPDEQQRNGEEAVSLAESACEATQRKAHAFLDTLAAAYAEVGRFEDAVAAEQEAIGLAKDLPLSEAVIDDYDARLKLYQSQQPFRHSVTTTQKTAESDD